MPHCECVGIAVIKSRLISFKSMDRKVYRLRVFKTPDKPSLEKILRDRSAMYPMVSRFNIRRGCNRNARRMPAFPQVLASNPGSWREMSSGLRPADHDGGERCDHRYPARGISHTDCHQV